MTHFQLPYLRFRFSSPSQIHHVPSQYQCRVCQETGDHPRWLARDLRYRSGEKFEYFQCHRCGCLQIAKIPDNIGSFYPSDYYSHQPLSSRRWQDSPLKARFRAAGRRLGLSTSPSARLVRRWLKTATHHSWLRTAGVSRDARILDVGCGSGALLLRMHKEGYTQAEGIDPLIPHDIHFPNGLVIRKAELADLPCSESYDFIMMHHSLEHVPDQLGTLRNVAQRLSDNGRALVRIPLAHYAWEHYRTDWVQLDPPRHLYLHTETSFRRIAEQAGLRLLSVDYDSYEFQFCGSELCRLGIPIPEHRRYLQQQRDPRFSRRQQRLWSREAKRLNDTGQGDMACFYLALKSTPPER